MRGSRVGCRRSASRREAAAAHPGPPHPLHDRERPRHSLAGGTLRLIWTFLPPILGTRKLVTLTTAMFLVPLIGWALAVQNPETPYVVLLLLGALAGIGGGAFSGFMPSTSYFFPRSKQGTALGLQAGIGNFGVSIVQFVTPWIIGFALLGGAAFLGESQTSELGRSGRVQCPARHSSAKLRESSRDRSGATPGQQVQQ